MPRYIDIEPIEMESKDRGYCTVSLQLINEQPTADVVPVVRCKECKHSEHWYKDKRRCFLWHEAGIDVFEDGFCSYGERKEDDKIHSR